MKKQAQPTSITNCCFNGVVFDKSTNETVVALAVAAQENAKAIQSIAEIFKLAPMTAPMIAIN